MRRGLQNAKRMRLLTLDNVDVAERGRYLLRYCTVVRKSCFTLRPKRNLRLHGRFPSCQVEHVNIYYYYYYRYYHHHYLPSHFKSAALFFILLSYISIPRWSALFSTVRGVCRPQSHQSGTVGRRNNQPTVLSLHCTASCLPLVTKCRAGRKRFRPFAGAA